MDCISLPAMVWKMVSGLARRARHLRGQGKRGREGQGGIREEGGGDRRGGRGG